MSRRLPLLALYLSDAISVTGNVLALIAIPWFVLELTGSAALTGVTAFFTTLATVIASFFGGALVDRIGFRRMSVIGDIASGLSVAAIPLIELVWGIETWELLVLVFLGALLDAPGTAARSSMLPDVAALAGTSLERATGISQAIRRGATLLGAPIGGGLIVVVGTTGVLWVDAASFGVSAALIGFLTPAVRHARSSPGSEAGLEPAATPGYLSDLVAGLRFIWSDRLARALVATVMLTNFLDAPIFAVIMPVYVREAYGSAVQLGLLFGFFGGAALVGALVFGVIGARLPRRLTFGLSFVIVGLPFWVLAVTPPYPVVLGAAAVMGLAAGPINPILSTVMYERVPADMRGRVLSSLTAGAYVAMPVGMLVAGFVSEQFGVTAAITGIAAAYLVVTGSIFLNPAMREMDRPGGAPAAAGAP
ncbi:MAG TPA: MFS transporter [Candidatus Limnocylindrales bacterium]|nr:MFS transporter [Candidatus Limnocylindrales bacterium]